MPGTTPHRLLPSCLGPTISNNGNAELRASSCAVYLCPAQYSPGRHPPGTPVRDKHAGADGICSGKREIHRNAPGATTIGRRAALRSYPRLPMDSPQPSRQKARGVKRSSSHKRAHMCESFPAHVRQLFLRPLPSGSVLRLFFGSYQICIFQVPSRIFCDYRAVRRIGDPNDHRGSCTICGPVWEYTAPRTHTLRTPRGESVGA